MITAVALLLFWLLAGVGVAQLFRNKSMKRHCCQARQSGDQMICAPCGLIWDMNDPEPPQCQRPRKKAAPKVHTVSPLLIAPKGASFPPELPADVAADMVKTYQANRGGLGGMQAAYRLFLDRVEP